jgi:hypothetical protein
LVRYANGTNRWDYILVKFKKPLTPGVEFRFSMQVAQDLAAASPDTPQLDRIGAILLHDLPTNLTVDALLEGYQPFVETPAGVPIGMDPVTLSSTIIGNGENYLIVGVFHPRDSITFNPPLPDATWWKSTYLFDNFKMYRPGCNGATSGFHSALNTGCAGDTLTIAPQFSTAPLQWTVNNMDAGSSSSIPVVVPDSGSVTVRLVSDTGNCSDTAYTVVTARRVELSLSDTTLSCSAPMLVSPTRVYHNVTQNAVQATWYDLAGSFNLSSGTQISATLPDTGTYVLRLTHSTCVQLDTFHVGASVPLLLDDGEPFLLPEVRPEHCVNMDDGWIVFHDMGYPTPLQYTWNDPPMLAATDTASGLGAGLYRVEIRDADGRCETWTQNVPQMLDSCATISGVVRKTVDYACNTAFNDELLVFETVWAEPSGNLGISDLNGSYSFFVPPGNSTLRHVPQYPNMGNLCGNGVQLSLPVAGSIATRDLVDTVFVPVHDLATITVVYSAWVIANDGKIFCRVRNLGNVADECVVRVYADHPTIGVSITDPSFLGWAGDTALFDLGTLLPQEERSSFFRFPIPLDTDLIGTAVPVHIAVTPVQGEVNLANNIWSGTQWVVGAYDPNDKQVSPRGAPVSDLTPPTERRFTYTVRFQNTGNYPATRVLLTDTLHPLLDQTSLQMEYASHNVQAFVYQGVLYMDHQGIMLPDSMSDPEGSIGQVVFSIDAIASADIGDEILNTAYIYFDQNPPIVTNTVRNVYGLDFSTNLTEGSKTTNGFSMAYGQNGDVFYRTVPNGLEPVDLQVIDSRGSVVMFLDPSSSGRIPTDRITPGAYILAGVINGTRHAVRFVVFP